MTEQIHHQPEPLPLPRRGGTKEKVLEAILRHNPDPTAPKLTIARIARDIAGVTHQRISQIVKKEEKALGKEIIPRTNASYAPERNREDKKYVGELRAQGFSAEEIMELTGRSKFFVNSILSRIRKTEEEAAREKRNQKVEDLRKKGFGNKAIEKTLSLPVGTVEFILDKSRKADPETFRLRKKRRSKEEMEKYYDLVWKLRNENLTRLDIAKRLQKKDQSLQDSKFAVDAALSRKRMQEGRKAKNGVIFEAQNQASPLDA